MKPDNEIVRVYINEFTGLVRKFYDGKGWNLRANGTWQYTGVTEEAIKKLPYYKLQESK